MAIEEAFLAEHTFVGAEVDEIPLGGQMKNAHSVSRGIQEATDSNHDLECQSQVQERWLSSSLTMRQHYELLLRIKKIYGAVWFYLIWLLSSVRREIGAQM